MIHVSLCFCVGTKFIVCLCKLCHLFDMCRNLLLPALTQNKTHNNRLYASALHKLVKAVQTGDKTKLKNKEDVWMIKVWFEYLMAVTAKYSESPEQSVTPQLKTYDDKCAALKSAIATCIEKCFSTEIEKSLTMKLIMTHAGFILRSCCSTMTESDWHILLFNVRLFVRVCVSLCMCVNL